MVFYGQETCAVNLDQLKLLDMNFGCIGNAYYALPKLLYSSIAYIDSCTASGKKSEAYLMIGWGLWK